MHNNMCRRMLQSGFASLEGKVQEKKVYSLRSCRRVDTLFHSSLLSDHRHFPMEFCA